MAPSILSHRLLSPQGWQTVASIVSEMQTAGTPQRIIDRWLQGLERQARQETE